jgi:hypothetical protein
MYCLQQQYMIVFPNFLLGDSLHSFKLVLMDNNVVH